jgi:hypothetical protein
MTPRPSQATFAIRAFLVVVLFIRSRPDDKKKSRDQQPLSRLLVDDAAS